MPAGHRGADDGRVGLGVQMGGDHVPVVDLEQVVGAADQQHIRVEGRDHRPVAGQRIGIPAGEPVPVVALERREGAEAAAVPVQVPGPAAGQMLVQQMWFVLLQHPDVDQPAVRGVGQRDVDQPVVAADRQGRLGPAGRQRAEPRSAAAGQDNAQHPRDGHPAILPLPLRHHSVATLADALNFGDWFRLQSDLVV